MNNLKELENEQIMKLVKNGEVKLADLIDSGICPTCFNKQNDEVLYGDNTDKIIF